MDSTTSNPKFDGDNTDADFAPKPGKVKSKNLNKGFRATLSKLFRQTIALTSKNLKLSFRNFSATLAQLWIGVIFLILLIIIGAAIQATSVNDTTFVELKSHLDRSPLAAFPRCTVGPGKTECYNFAYSSTRGFNQMNVTAIEELVDRIAAKLGIDPTRNVNGGILSFGNATSDDVNNWILNNPNITKSIILFENSKQWSTDPNAPFRYIYRANSTKNCAEIGIYRCDEPWLQVHVPLISALNAAFISLYGGDPDTQIKVEFSNFPHPDLPNAFDAMKEFGTLFIYIALTFNYVVLTSTIVREKELHLVESMRQMGMMNSAYWLSWLISATVTNTIMVFLLMIFGAILQFQLFLETSPQLLITILWLSAEAFTSMSFFFSSFLRTTSSARLIGVMVFIITFIAAPSLYQTYYQDPTEEYNLGRWVVAIFPFFSFYHALQTVIERSSGSLASGMTWEQRTDNLLAASALNANPTFWSVDSSLKWLVASFFIFSALAWYLEQITPNEYGRSKVPWFFLKPSFWGWNIPRLGCCRRNDRIGTGNADLVPVFEAETDEDVKTEANAVHENNTTGFAIVLRGVTKVFNQRNPISRAISRCLCGEDLKGFIAVNKVFYGMNYGQLTAILGHNGSGKSTTFNMLTGLMSVSDGDAEIFGRSVSGDMSELHATMGVCPQHDVLWDQLTAREHLELFARIKGFDENVSGEANARLDQVKLNSAADSNVKGYSGGMKRRLSIAIAMLGEPSVVFLDEPTTGMDPVTRREVLEMISESKNQDRVIILTSHAMEEVEMLADKVVVMSRGKVQAIGSNLRLKKRFGLGYKMTMFGTTQTDLNAYMQPLASNLGGVVNVTTDGSACFVGLPKATPAQLTDFFRTFEVDKKNLGVEDFSLALSTLEEVFLNLSKSEEEREAEKVFGTKLMRDRFKQCEAYQPKAKEKNKVSLSAQVNALFWKSFSFQLKNFGTCCCTILFPVLIMLLMIVLDKILFQPAKFKAVCGDAKTKSDCLVSGLDLDCIANKQQFRPLNTINSVTVGTISRGRRPINANCNRQICFSGLEKMDSREFPISFDTNDVGGLNQSYTSVNSQSLFDWHADLLFILDRANSNCTTTLTEAFDSKQCPNSPASVRTACLDDLTKLTEAKQYLDGQEAQTTTSFSTGSCAQTNGVQRVPAQSYIDRVEALNDKVDQCFLDALTNFTVPHFSKFNLFNAITAETSTVSSGLMGSFSLQSVINSELLQLNTQLWRSVNAVGPQVLGANYAIARDAWFNSIGVDPLDKSFTPTVHQMCTASVTLNVTVIAPFTTQLLVIFGSSPSTLQNVCAVFGNLDKVRGTSTLSFGSNRAQLDDHLYRDWFGDEVSTTYMKTDNPDMLKGAAVYLQRQYYADFGGVHIKNSNGASLEYVIYHNVTATGGSSIGNWIQLVQLTESTFMRNKINRDFFFRTQDMPLKSSCNRNEWLENPNIDLNCDFLPTILKLSILDFVAVQLFPFLFFTYAFLIVNQLVYEKENKLRVIMKMNGGLTNTAYFLVAFVFFFVQFIVMAGLIYGLGNFAKLKFTALHSPGVYWGFVISWGCLLVVFSFLISIFFSSTETSTAGVFLFVLVINLVGIQLINNLINDPLSTEQSYAALMWLPPFVMIRVTTWMGLAGAFGQKISDAGLFNFADGALRNSFIIMWGEFLACLLLVWYLDNVYVAGFGTRKHPLFFLSRRYWTGEKQGNDKPLKDFEISENVKDSLTTINNPDVVAEYERVIDETSPNLIVRVVRLNKEFDNGYIAVKSLSLGINENECFGLLGHNGAGKTTAISMLVGLYEPTFGTALVDGCSINTDMEAVQTRMGVCPQHDVCWGPLSVRDHLLFYARLKGVPNDELSIAIDKALFDVNLKQFEWRQANKLSGGMRRRLSTAMSLIGTPRVVYLDEPSTGLDPASKRALWNVIAKAKGNKSLVLTTHSMEEAEVLCDRIGIMALGELQCIGTAPELKRRYGTGYTFFIVTRKASAAQINGFVDKLFGQGNSRLLQKPIGGSYKFEVKRESVILSNVFSLMESSDVQNDLSLLDWSLTETTLEEVFLKLADLAHVDEALSAKPKEAKGFSLFSCCTRKSKSSALTKQEELAVVAAEDKV